MSSNSIFWTFSFKQRSNNIPYVVYFDQRFCAKNLKIKKFAANFCKKQFFLSLHRNAGQLFYSKKTAFSLKNLLLLTINSVWSAQHSNAENAGRNIQQRGIFTCSPLLWISLWSETSTFINENNNNQRDECMNKIERDQNEN